MFLLIFFQVSTLRFALRIMCVSVEPTINEHFDPWLLVRELDTEIKRLKQVEFIRTIYKKIFFSDDATFLSQCNHVRIVIGSFNISCRTKIPSSSFFIVATKKQKKKER